MRKNPAKFPPNFPANFPAENQKYSPTSFCRSAGRKTAVFIIQENAPEETKGRCCKRVGFGECALVLVFFVPSCRFLCPCSGFWCRRSVFCILVPVLGVQGTSAKTTLLETTLSCKHPKCAAQMRCRKPLFTNCFLSSPSFIRNEKSAQRPKFSAGRPCGHPAKNFGQALQILEKQACRHGHAARTSTKKLRSEKLRADFSFPISGKLKKAVAVSGENPGAFLKARSIFQEQFSFPENAQTLAGIAFFVLPENR